MKLTIDEIPLSKNKFMNMKTKNWGYMEHKRKRYKEMIQWLIYQKWLEVKGNECLEKAKVTFNIYFKCNRRRDTQNYLGGGLISWLDALVDLKIIKDDCWECIGQPIVNFFKDKDYPRTEIIIERRK